MRIVAAKRPHWLPAASRSAALRLIWRTPYHIAIRRIHGTLDTPEWQALNRLINCARKALFAAAFSSGIRYPILTTMILCASGSIPNRRNSSM
jgi:hypothetical protein